MRPDYQEELVRAVINKLAPDIHKALRDCDSYTLTLPHNSSIKIPLIANVSVAYNKGQAAFCVRGEFRGLDVKDVKSSEVICSQSMFSDMDLRKCSDASVMLDHLFDKLKHQFNRYLVEQELTERESDE